jgi:hypothetical protein
MLGIFGLVLFGTGIYALFRRSVTQLSFWFVTVWGLGALAFLITFASGNVRHDYYQIPLVPLVCLIVALGINYLLELKSFWSQFLLLASCLLFLAFSWHFVSGYYHINNWAIVEAGQAVDELTPKDALVIAPYLGDTSFLYQTNRRGWPVGTYIKAKMSLGAQYYVSVNYEDEARALEAVYPTIKKTNQYLILKLKSEN